ncbi:uncharacterized protein LOC117174928 [Belonocnema kinseyi]|uniref:uncharacterized protein LOC117174928 n=1 Tax=Belonocnema kinseyi TaxID=2817044 RepID=UPI00143D8721|nr:uncharacterized protein LOC117174928 [Belonocnema kinseyi]
MVNCVVPVCKEYTGKRNNKEKCVKVTFHKFPLDPVRRQEWADKIGVNVGALKVYSRICSSHFPEEMIDRTSLSCVRLRDNALPCINTSRDEKYAINRCTLERMDQREEINSPECAIKLEIEENTDPYFSPSSDRTSTSNLHVGDDMETEKGSNPSVSSIKLEKDTNSVDPSSGSGNVLKEEIVLETVWMDDWGPHTEIPEQAGNNPTVTSEMSTQTDDFCLTELYSTRRRPQRDFGTRVSPERIFNSPVRTTLRKELANQKLKYTHRIQMLQQKLRRKEKRIDSLTSFIKGLRDKKVLDDEQFGVFENIGSTTPLFKFGIDGTERTNKIIRGASVVELINVANEKFCLPEDNYKICLEEDKTEVDDDDVLLEYTQQCERHARPPISVLLKAQNYRDDQENTENDPDILNDNIQENLEEIEIAQPITSETSLNLPLHSKIDLDYVWKRVPERLITACQAGEVPDPGDRRTMIQVIVDYMLDELKDCTRGTSERIAKKICAKYPISFMDIIEGQIFGKGMENLRMQIYNRVNFVKSSKKRRKIRPIDDSDDEDETENTGSTNKRYLLENEHLQELKRLELLELFNRVNGHTAPAVSKLMELTYPAQRKLITEEDRNLATFLTDWPFLKVPQFFMEHASVLLGKNVQKSWDESLENKAKAIRKFLQIKQHAGVNHEEILQLLKTAKEAALVTKNNIPKSIVVFPMIIKHFGENADYLYKVIKDDIADEDTAKHAVSFYPSLIIRGKSLYDEDATCTVVLENNTLMFCTSVLEGFLITFISYYVYGYKYPKEIECTLEFIQRIIMKISPQTGGKRGGAKRKAKSFNSTVFKFAEQLNKFTNLFSL